MSLEIKSILVQLVIGVVFLLALVIIIVIFVKKIKQWLRRRYLEEEGVNRRVIAERWQEIEKLMESKGEMSRKVAVMEADKLLDYTLKSMAMPGNTLGERLKFASYKYDKIKSVWFAHKIRNKLVHETSFHLDKRLAEKAIREFAKALKELGAL